MNFKLDNNYCGAIIHIVASQRGGVSDKPPWLRAATRHGPGMIWIRNKLHCTKKSKDGPYTGHVLLRQGEPGTSQYICSKFQHDDQSALEDPTVLSHGLFGNGFNIAIHARGESSSSPFN